MAAVVRLLAAAFVGVVTAVAAAALVPVAAARTAARADAAVVFGALLRRRRKETANGWLAFLFPQQEKRNKDKMNCLSVHDLVNNVSLLQHPALSGRALTSFLAEEVVSKLIWNYEKGT